jgi:hypothetical protein
MSFCDSPIEGGPMAYLCSVEKGHDGPHATIELPRTIAEREQWTNDRPAWNAMNARRIQAKNDLGQTQGPALGFWQNIGEEGGGTAVPGPLPERTLIPAALPVGASAPTVEQLEDALVVARRQQAEHAGADPEVIAEIAADEAATPPTIIDVPLPDTAAQADLSTLVQSLLVLDATLDSLHAMRDALQALVPAS